MDNIPYIPKDATIEEFIEIFNSTVPAINAALAEIYANKENEDGDK